MEGYLKAPIKPRVQVLLPTYNAASWFEQALGSVASEDGIEVLVIDDGSELAQREAVSSVCSRFSNVRLFFRPHMGIVGALNYGLSIATSEFVGRMDADDISLPGRFAAQVDFLDRNTDVVVVGTQIKLVDQLGTTKHNSPVYPCESQALVDQLYEGRCLLQHPSVLMRREDLVAVGGYDPQVEYAEDYDLWLRLSRRGQIRNLETVYLLHRRHELQITNPDNIKQKIARDISLVRASLSLRGKSPNPGEMECLNSNVREYFSVADKISRGMSLTWSDAALLWSVYCRNLLGEGSGFKKRLIKKIRSGRLIGGWGKTYLTCALLLIALKISSARFIGASLLVKKKRS